MKQPPREPRATRVFNTLKVDLSGNTSPHDVELNGQRIPGVRSVRIETDADGTIIAHLAFPATVVNKALTPATDEPVVVDVAPATVPMEQVYVREPETTVVSQHCAVCDVDLSLLSTMEQDYVNLAVTTFGMPLCPPHYRAKKEAQHV